VATERRSPARRRVQALGLWALLSMLASDLARPAAYAQAARTQPPTAPHAPTQPVPAQASRTQPVPAQASRAQPVPAQASRAQPVQGQPVQGQPVQGQPVQGQAETRRERIYLSQLALLVEGSRRLVAFGEGHVDDRDLLKFAHPLAERYVEMANHMLPPPKVVVAHPHLMLVVENLERAVDAAASGDAATYQKRMRIARDELANLEAVLKQLKLRLPELSR
jgi:hypothetical protein